jgi:glucose-1-phosphate thymidylyltransferase
MMAGIREVLIISTPHDLPEFRQHFGDGAQLGMWFSFGIQYRPQVSGNFPLGNLGSA